MAGAMRVLVPLLALLIPLGAVASPTARRLPHEPYPHAFERLRHAPFDPDTVYGRARPVSELDFSRLPSVSKLGAMFQELRNDRWISDASMPDFPRRIPWLYPDDGCFVRAQESVEHLAAEGVTATQKLFIFGDLEVATPNSPDGQVPWWFHVMPAFLSGGTPYVIDPAMEPSRPLTVSEWIARMTSDPSSVELALCDATAYEPESYCEGEPGSTEAQDRADADAPDFLQAEWNRQLELGRDPSKVLGGNWLPMGP
jgi:hypothetical protein